MKNTPLVKHTSSIAYSLWLWTFFCVCITLFGAVWFFHNSIICTFLDETIHQWSISIRSPQMTSVMIFLSLWGSWGTAIIWTGVFIAMAVKKRRKYVLYSLWLSLGGWLVSEGLKLLFSRPRPTDWIWLPEISQSFPSSHAVTSIILYISLSLFCFHFSRKFGRAFAVFTLGLIISMLIGISRVYLGLHYATDVMAGYYLGLAFFFISHLFFRKIH